MEGFPARHGRRTLRLRRPGRTVRARRQTMTAGIIFTGTGPILILTSYSSFSDQAFKEKLARKGIMKFIAYELDVETVRKRYGQQFEVIAKDLYQEDDLRVLDYNGHNVFYNFSFKEFGPPILHE
jgi:hypothetical protein